MASLLLRKAWRLSAFVFSLIYYFSTKQIASLITSYVLCFFLLLEFLRFSFPRFNQRILSIFHPILIEKERRQLLSATWLILSSLLTIILFQKGIAITAMLFLVFGDISSAIIGRSFGRNKVNGRSLEGSLAFFVTCLIIGGVLSFTQIGLPSFVIIAGALAAALIELLPYLNDNFTISIFSAWIMTLALKSRGL